MGSFTGSFFTSKVFVKKLIVPLMLVVCTSTLLFPGISSAAYFMGLGDLPGGNYLSIAFGVSDDGRVVVGTSISANGREAFRWTAETGMQSLGDCSGGIVQSTAYSISADGFTIVGTCTTEIGQEAFIWKSQSGIKSTTSGFAGGS